MRWRQAWSGRFSGPSWGVCAAAVTVALAAAGAGPAAAGSLAGSVAPSAQEAAETEVTGLIVTYAEPAGAGERLAAAVAADTDLEAGVAVTDRVGTLRLDEPVDVATAEAAAAELEADPRVLSAEPDLPVHAAGSLRYPTDDPLLDQQWGLADAAGVRVAGAWRRTDGAGVRVAVLDTGSTGHPDLDGRWLPGYDMVSVEPGDGDGRDPDASDPGDGIPGFPSSWHGTHVAGILAGTADNGEGVAGVAPGARIVPVRVLGSQGGVTSDIIAGLRWAAGLPVSGVPANPNPARVANLSLAGPLRACPTALQEAITATVSAGVTVVVAAGNHGGTAGDRYPANCDGVVVVGATGPTGAPVDYSNRGSAVDLTAPGGTGSPSASSGILSTYNSGAQDPGSPTYAVQSGTSMAAPHVAGAAALLLARRPWLSPRQVEARLEATARSTTGCTLDRCGAGVVDATRLLDTPAERRVTDFTGDGVPDTVARAADGRLLLYPGNGRGGFLSGRQIGHGWQNFRYLVSPGDVTGDRVADLLAMDSSWRFWLYAGDGAGRVRPGRVVGSGWGGMNLVAAAGDVTGDGSGDLVARDRDGRLRLYPMAGGTFRTSRVVGGGWQSMTAIVAAGDANGDGRGDLYARAADGRLLLYRGTGTGTVTGGGVAATGWQGYTAISGPGDRDRDGVADVLARDADGTLWHFAGDGRGGFLPRVRTGSGWNGITSLP